MTSPFFGLDLATRALRANQRLVDITNQNIANANTPGYSRQTAVISETLPYPIPVFRQSGEAGQLGTGVEIKEIERARDSFIDYQYRNQVSGKGRWDARNNAMKQVEAVLNEPNASGLGKTLTRYWQAWQEVANSPSDVSVRANLLEQGRAVADAFNNTIRLLEQQQRDMDLQITLGVDDINNYATQIANLNVQISHVESGGMNANDLRDQRDLLVDKLSSLASVTTVESSEGSLSVYIGGHTLVDRDDVKELGVDTNSGTFARVIWAGTASPGTSVNLLDGKMKGLIESRDELLQGRLDNVNALGQRIIEQVNSVHAAGVGIDGVGGLKFFTGTNARDMAVDPTLTANSVAAARMVSNGAGGYTYAVGDSSNAVALAQLQSTLAQRGSTGLTTGSTVGTSTVLGVDVSRAAKDTSFELRVNADNTVDMRTLPAGAWAAATLTEAAGPSATRVVTIDGGSNGVRLTVSGATFAAALAGVNGQTVSTAPEPSTIGDQYGKEIAATGVLASTARGQASNQQVLVSHLQRQREEISGVSIDEEATHLIQYQHAYQAAARVISVMDAMLDVLINRTGAR
jgi:flagellar hook-associated protein 1 FlgK